MSNLYVQIALDFVECTKEQKERFLLHLEDLNWKPLNPNKLWTAEFDNSKNKENKLVQITVVNFFLDNSICLSLHKFAIN